MLPEFRNEPFTDFSIDSNAKAFRGRARGVVEKRLPLHGRNPHRRQDHGERPRGFESVNPCNFKQVIGRFPEGTVARRRAGPSTPPRRPSRPGAGRPARERSALVLRWPRRSAGASTSSRPGWSRGRQDVGRGRRRHRRGDRLLEFYAREMLRLRAAAAAHAHTRARTTSSSYIPLGVGRRDPAVELPARDPGRHDDGRARRRQHGRAQAVVRLAGDRGDVRRDPARRPACRGRRSTSSPAAGRRSATRWSSTRRRASSPSPARRRSGCSINEQAGKVAPGQIWIKRVDRRDGRQGRHRRRRGRRPRRGGRRHRRRRPSASRGRSARPARARIVHEAVYDELLEHDRREDEDADGRRRPRPRKRRSGPVDQRAARRRRSSSTSSREEGRAPRRRRRGRPERRATSSSRRSSPTSSRRARSRRRRSSARCSRSSRRRTSTTRSRIANDTEYGLTGAATRATASELDARQARVPRRQPLPQPQVHRRAGRRASVRRLQHVRHGLEGRRPRLPAPVHPGEGDLGKAVRRTRCTP